MVDLITEEQRVQLLINGRLAADRGEQDLMPIVKLFTPDAGATWLLTELDPNDPDVAFGLCDVGEGYPELGHVRLSELSKLRGPLKQPVKRDQYFRADKTLFSYHELAVARGYVQT